MRLTRDQKLLGAYWRLLPANIRAEVFKEAIVASLEPAGNASTFEATDDRSGEKMVIGSMCIDGLIVEALKRRGLWREPKR